MNSLNLQVNPFQDGTMDLYSRKVLGYNVEAHMRAESCHAALAMAFRARGGRTHGHGLIHHSDRGGQYVSDLYTGLLGRMEARISMCLVVYENSHMERLNRTIKGEYLAHRRTVGLRGLKRELAKAVRLYNDQRPHDSLKGLAPTAFESALAEIPESERKPMTAYVDPATSARNKVRNQMSIFD